MAVKYIGIIPPEKYNEVTHSAFYERLNELNARSMTKYPSTNSDSRPFPIGKHGGSFCSLKEKLNADEYWKQNFL